MKQYTGSCLCGHISYTIQGKSSFPHLCSCRMCQKWSGAPTVAWAEFPIEGLKWDGPGGEPSFYRSSEKTKRGFCPKCGGTMCALDDGYNHISITIASLTNPNLVIPGNQHSYQEQAPLWWRVKMEC